MIIRFTKMHGLGNDFVVIDGVRQAISLSAETIARLADRHFGIGFDQLLLVERPMTDDGDFGYLIFNADGGEVSQCGNGARCFARFVREQGLCPKDEVKVDTRAGRLVLRHDNDGQITVDMGIPRHRPAEIPLQVDADAHSYAVEAHGQIVHFGAVSMGNPHAVLRVDDVARAPVGTLGPLLENHPVFPQRANIGFMQVIDRNHIALRVFERGSGETLACGSGACGAVVVGIEQRILESPVRVDLPGGSLMIEWQGRGHPVSMTGPAVSVFHGEIEL